MRVSRRRGKASAIRLNFLSFAQELKLLRAEARSRAETPDDDAAIAALGQAQVAAETETRHSSNGAGWKVGAWDRASHWSSRRRCRHQGGHRHVDLTRRFECTIPSRSPPIDADPGLWVTPAEGLGPSPAYQPRVAHPLSGVGGGEHLARFVVPTVASSVDLVVHLGIDEHGVRRVNEIVSVPGGWRTTSSRPSRCSSAATASCGGPPAPTRLERFRRIGIDVHQILAGGR